MNKDFRFVSAKDFHWYFVSKNSGLANVKFHSGAPQLQGNACLQQLSTTNSQHEDVQLTSIYIFLVKI